MLVTCLVLIALLPISITEDEQHQFLIVSNQNVMKLFIGCLEYPSFSKDTHMKVLCCLENLSYNPYTHKYLSNVDIIGALMMVADKSLSSPIYFEGMDPAICANRECDLVK